MALEIEPKYFSLFFHFDDSDVYGFVTGTSAREVFEALDEYGDPYQCLIKPIGCGAAVFYVSTTGTAENNFEDGGNTDYEVTENAPMSGDCRKDVGWRWFKDWFESEGEEVNLVDRLLLNRGIYSGKV